jgi:hypothetical protein
MAEANNKLTQMTAQLNANAGVESKRQLRKLLRCSIATKNHNKEMIADLAGLYRCVHKGTGKVLWVSNDEDATLRAEELGFLAPDLRAPDSEVSDVDADEGGDPAMYADDEAEIDKADESKEVPLELEVQNLKRRLTALDAGVVDLDSTMAVSVDKEDISGQEPKRAQPEASNACILL